MRWGVLYALLAVHPSPSPEEDVSLQELIAGKGELLVPSLQVGNPAGRNPGVVLDTTLLRLRIPCQVLVQGRIHFHLDHCHHLLTGFPPPLSSPLVCSQPQMITSPPPQHNPKTLNSASARRSRF